MSGSQQLRGYLSEGKFVWSIGVTDPAQAKLVKRSGFDAVAIQSYQSSLSQGLPDVGTITPEETLRLVSRVWRACNLPVIVDFEQGFGESYNTVYWVKEFEKAGAAAVHIDDMAYPYLCPNIPPGVPELDNETRTAGKIRAIKDVSSSSSPLIIARTAANYSGKYSSSKQRGMDEAVRRLRMYKQAGADILLVQSSSSLDLKYFRKNLEGPLMTQTVADWSGSVIKSESIPLNVDELKSLGYQIVNEAINITRLGLKAIQIGLADEFRAKSSEVLNGRMLSRQEVDELMEIEKVSERRKEYSD